MILHPKIAANGAKYWVGSTGTIFLQSSETKVTLKLRVSKNGVTKTRKWLCFSKTSGKLRVYYWTPRKGILDISYCQNAREIIRVICRQAEYKGYINEFINPPQIQPYEEIASALSILLNTPVSSWKIDEVVIKEVLPFLQQYSRDIPAIPKAIIKGLKKTNLKEVVQECFGRSNKQLVKLVGELLLPDQLYQGISSINLTLLVLAVKFSQDWELDYIHKLLAVKPFSVDVNKLYLLLQHYSPSRVITLVNQQGNFLQDAARMYAEIINDINGYKLPERPRNAKQLHDWVMRDYQRIISEREENKLLPTEKLGYLEGVPVGNMIIRVPTIGKTLIEWGNSLNICISFYTDYAIKKNCYLLGVEQYGAIKYALEINPRGEIVQFVGEDNSFPDAESATIINAFLKNELAKAFPPSVK